MQSTPALFLGNTASFGKSGLRRISRQKKARKHRNPLWISSLSNEFLA